MMAIPWNVLASWRVGKGFRLGSGKLTEKGESHQDKERIHDGVQDIEDAGLGKESGTIRPVDGLVICNLGRCSQGCFDFLVGNVMAACISPILEFTVVVMVLGCGGTVLEIMGCSRIPMLVIRIPPMLGHTMAVIRWRSTVVDHIIVVAQWCGHLCDLARVGTQVGESTREGLLRWEPILLNGCPG